MLRLGEGGRNHHHLLKGVVLKDLKAEDVEDAHVAPARPIERGIDPPHDQRKQRPVDVLGRGGAALDRLRRPKLDVRCLAVDVERAAAARLLEFGGRHLPKLGYPRGRLRVRHRAAGLALSVGGRAKGEVAEEEDAGECLEDLLDLLLVKSKISHRREHRRVVLALVVAVERVARRAVEETVGGGVVQAKLLAGIALAEHVEDVVGALVGRLVDNARLLEQVLLNSRTGDGAGGIEVHLDPTAEARGVVVANRLRVAEGLEERRGAQHL